MVLCNRLLCTPIQRTKLRAVNMPKTRRITMRTPDVEQEEPPAKRAKKEEKGTFLERVSSKWKVGAHVSAAGGVENAVVNAATIGANAFALFVKSQRKWTSPPLTAASVELFKSRMEQYGYSSSVVLPHGSYLINLGNPDEEKRRKSYECFVDDLKRCEQLGLELYNFHPGSSVGATTTSNCLSLIAEAINRAHKETKYITTVLENMAGAGNIIGGDFAHLKGIIAEVDDKTRVGVCLDTCHAFSAGYDIRSEEGWNATLEDFDKEIGLSFLRGMHLNDSKTEFNSKKDRHENIGLGHLGLATFKHILSDSRLQGIPLILETPSFECPSEIWGQEINVLQSMAGFSEKPESVEDGSIDLLQKIKNAVAAASASGKGKKRAVTTKTNRNSTAKSMNKKRDVETDEDEES